MIAHSRPWIKGGDIEGVAGLLRRGLLATGVEADKFAAALSAYLGTRDGTLTHSGTEALVLALRAVGAGPGDEVVLPTYVCRAVLDAVLVSGARPVLCDTGPDWLMTPEAVDRRVTARTRAVILVHLFGIALDVDAFRNNGAALIEDCCQSLGAAFGEDMVGGKGACAVYSFHATKCLATGEGGFLTSRDPVLLERAAKLCRDNPLIRPMTDFQAALGLGQLARYGTFLERRRRLARRYFEALPSALTGRLAPLGDRSVFFRFPVTPPSDFDTCAEHCARRGVIVRRGVDALLHRQLGLDDGDFPNAVRAFDSTLSIPLYPSLSNEEQERVIEALCLLPGCRR